MFQGRLMMDLTERWLGVVKDLPDTSCHRIAAQLNYAEVHLNASSSKSKSKSINCDHSLDMLDSICQVVQELATATGNNELYDDCIQNEGSCDHDDIYPAFYAYAKQKCLVLLSWASHSILGDSEKFQEYGNEASE
jgi:hypothetical protein